MSPTIIFQLQLVLGYVAWLLCFAVYIFPRLKAMDRLVRSARSQRYTVFASSVLSF